MLYVGLVGRGSRRAAPRRDHHVVTFYLIDTSAWAEWFRGADSPAARAVARIRADPAEIAVTQPVALEVRAGTRRANPRAVDRIRENAVQLSVEPNIDFDAA